MATRISRIAVVEQVHRGAVLFFKHGVGLAAAILIDATIVRGVLLPATMKLLGDWNWYLPSWLGGCRASTPSKNPRRVGR